MSLVGLAIQVLEWRINAPSNTSKTKFQFPSSSLFTFCTDDIHPNANVTEYPSFLLPKTRMTWTGSKIDLVELIYAWEEIGCFNHGNVNIKELVAYIEVIFNIDLGDYYGTFREMRNRVNQTAFLDKLIKVLKDRMDEVDRKK
jgi:hypothetical protein